MKTFNAEKAARRHTVAMQAITHKVVGKTGALYGYHDSEKTAEQHAEVLNKTGTPSHVVPVSAEERARITAAGRA